MSGGPHKPQDRPTWRQRLLAPHTPDLFLILILAALIVAAFFR
jgi:hypothetical protein